MCRQVDRSGTEEGDEVVKYKISLGVNHIVAQEGEHGVSSLQKYAVLCL